MSKQITTSPSNRKISALYKDIKRENLILQPDFQRRSCGIISIKKNLLTQYWKGIPYQKYMLHKEG